MNPDTTKIKYFIYGRKSSESDEKQVQSIEDQVLIMDGIRKSYGFKVVDTLTEAKSAKEPHGRKVFEEMLDRIEKGEAQGILVWKIDRLSRNPIDSARVQWLLQKEVIQSIRTPDREYRPEDNALLLSVESSMANQYIRDLSKNVKRGLKSKLDKGWMPGTAPLGYLNTKTENRGENYIVKDEERFLVLRRAWDLMLTGNYVAEEILDKLNNEWGFRTRAWKKKGSKPMSRSTIYKMFTNCFYAGIIPYKGLFVEGKHPAMITLEEFDRVQFILGREGKRRPNRYEYAYTGQIVCGECTGVISATHKEKLIKSTGKLHSYILYYCVCARKNEERCSQRNYTNVDQIDEHIEVEIDRFSIMPEFKEWALSVLAEYGDTEIDERTKIYEAQQKILNDTQKQLDNLTQMRLRDMVDDDEYSREKGRLKGEMARIKTKLKDTEVRAESWIELTEKAFEFALYAHKAFLFGTPEVKKEILNAIGLNQTLIDNIFRFDAIDWVEPIQERYPSLEAKIKAFEPEKYGTEQWEKAAFAAFGPEVRERRDLNPQPLP